MFVASGVINEHFHMYKRPSVSLKLASNLVESFSLNWLGIKKFFVSVTKSKVPLGPIGLIGLKSLSLVIFISIFSDWIDSIRNNITKKIKAKFTFIFEIILFFINLYYNNF